MLHECSQFYLVCSWRTIVEMLTLKLLSNRKLSSFRGIMGFPGGSDSKESTCKVGDFYSIPGSGRCLEKGMATHTSTLAWRLSRTDKSGGSMGLQSQTRLSNQHFFMCSFASHFWPARPRLWPGFFSLTYTNCQGHQILGLQKVALRLACMLT